MNVTQIASSLGIAGLLLTLIGSIISANGIRTKPPKGAPIPEPGTVNLFIDGGPVRNGLFAIAIGTGLQIVSVVLAGWLGGSS